MSYEMQRIIDEMCAQCLNRVGSLNLVFGLMREARFVRLSVAHKWHLMNSAPAYRNWTLCNRIWGGEGE